MATQAAGWRNLAARIALMWLLVAGISLAVSLGNLANTNIRGDDALRLVQVRDLLAGQAWFDLHQYRLAPPHGVVMHWSRLVDLPILFVIAGLTPVIGAVAAETAALVIVPLTVLAVSMAAVGWSAARLFDLRTAGFAALAIGLLPQVVAQMQPTVIDHHGWQAAMVALASAGFVAGRGWQGPVLAGIAMAVGTSISLEVVTMAAAFALVFGLRWVMEREMRAQLALYLASFAGGLALVFLATLGPANWVQYCDAIGPAHMLLFGLVAGGVALVARVDPPRPLFVVGSIGVVGALGLGAFALAAPQCLASPFGTLAPDVQAYWYDLVMEGRPIWEQDFALAAPVCLQLAVGLAAAIYLARSRGGIWPLYTVLLACALLFGFLTWRSLAFAGVVAALPIGWLITTVLARVEQSRSLPVKGALLAALVLALMPSLLTDRLQRGAEVSSADESQPVASVTEADCHDPARFARFSQLPRGTVAMPFDMGPAMLAHTPHSVLATGHHRAAQAMAESLRIFRSSPDRARVLVQRNGVDYIFLCTELSDTQVYARSAPQGLAAMLLHGSEPAWLERVPGLDTGTFRVWRVR